MLNINRVHKRIINMQRKATPPVKQGPVLFELRRYGDPFMKAMMELDTATLGTGNFQNIDFFTLQNAENTRGGFGAVSNFQPIDSNAVVYLKSIQPKDSVELKRKMNWLGVEDFPTVNTEGRPYMVKGGRNTWGTMAFGGQRIQVEAVNGIPVLYQFLGKYQGEPGGTLHKIDFYKVIGLRKSDMTRPVSELLAEGLIQRATEAYYPTNEYNDHPQGGTILCPVWSPLDYPTNYGKNVVFIAKDFLLPIAA